MVWKLVDDVIYLDEQQRMKDDMEYGGAILRLRKHKCIREDVDLLNHI